MFLETATEPPTCLMSQVDDSDAMSLHHPKPRTTASIKEGSMSPSVLSSPNGVDTMASYIPNHLKRNQIGWATSPYRFDSLKMLVVKQNEGL